MKMAMTMMTTRTNHVMEVLVPLVWGVRGVLVVITATRINRRLEVMSPPTRGVRGAWRARPRLGLLVGGMLVLALAFPLACNNPFLLLPLLLHLHRLRLLLRLHLRVNPSTKANTVRLSRTLQAKGGNAVFTGVVAQRSILGIKLTNPELVSWGRLSNHQILVQRFGLK